MTALPAAPMTVLPASPTAPPTAPTTSAPAHTTVAGSGHLFSAWPSSFDLSSQLPSRHAGFGMIVWAAASDAVSARNVRATSRSEALRRTTHLGEAVIEGREGGDARIGGGAAVAAHTRHQPPTAAPCQ